MTNANCESTGCVIHYNISQTVIQRRYIHDEGGDLQWEFPSQPFPQQKQSVSEEVDKD